MTAMIGLSAIGAFAVGCYIAYLLYAELCPSNTFIGRRQREIRIPATKGFACSCMVILFICAALLLLLTIASGAF